MYVNDNSSKIQNKYAYLSKILVHKFYPHFESFLNEEMLLKRLNQLQWSAYFFSVYFSAVKFSNSLVIS